MHTYMHTRTHVRFHVYACRLTLAVATPVVPFSYYEPQKFVLQNYGDPHSAKRLCDWVKDVFADRVLLPPGTTMLYPSGA